MVLIKDYPLRGVNLKEINEKKLPVCTCGHFDYNHDVDMKLESKHGECRDCTCPKYEYYMHMTRDQVWELDRKRNRINST